jgi:hypothetical protein
MSNTDPAIKTLLNDHVPLRVAERPDWNEVLRRIGASETHARVTWPAFLRPRRRYAVASLALVVLLAPLIAIGATAGWWFTGTPAVPKPEGTIVVLKSGRWNGTPWALAAYRSAGNVCFALTPNWTAQDDGTGAGMACGVPLRGVAQQSASNPVLHWIGYLTSAPENGFPAWIAGPTAPEVSTVDVVLRDGKTTTAPTFAAAAELGLKINFYVARLACGDAVRALIPSDADGHALERWALPSFSAPPSETCGNGS